MYFGQSLGLCGEFSAGGHSNHIIDVAVGVQILVSHVANDLRLGKIAVRVEDDKAAPGGIGGKLPSSIAFGRKCQRCCGTSHLTDAPNLGVLSHSTGLQGGGYVGLGRKAVRTIGHGEQTWVVDRDIIQPGVITLRGHHINGVFAGTNGVFEYGSVGAR